MEFPVQPGRMDRAGIENVVRGIADPEIPVVSIHELGILRDLRWTRDPSGGDSLEVVITPTYSACPAIAQIEEEITSALERHGFSGTVSMRLAPAWSSDWIAPQVREKPPSFGSYPVCSFRNVDQ